MDQPHSEENVRDLLDRRERELTQQIQLLQNELAALRNDLTPKEVELIEVRRAKAALGMVAETPRLKTASFPWQSEKQPINSGADRENSYRTFAMILKGTPALELKIKELLVLAFIEHFQQHGATPADLRNQIHTSYGREIDPGSIRPNLARLREDGIVMRAIPPKWIFRPEAAMIMVPTYFNGDLLRAAAAMAWREDDTQQPASIRPAEKPHQESTRAALERLMRRAGAEKS
jgi:hypothetical protein